MAHFDDAKELVKHAKNTLPKLEQGYNSSLNEKTVKPSLLIDIKNLLENLRSALDFCAGGLFANHCSSTKANRNIYFPFALLRETQAQFQASGQSVEKRLPGLSVARPDIVARLESYQYYSHPANKWLPQFMELNNENKHEKLTPQTRTEAKELRIESRGVGLHLGPGAFASVGPGAVIQVGDAIVVGSQTFGGTKPATVLGVGTQTVITWVSFTFGNNGEPVLPFLQNAVAQVERIVNELAAL